MRVKGANMGVMKITTKSKIGFNFSKRRPRENLAGEKKLVFAGYISEKFRCDAQKIENFTQNPNCMIF